MKNIFKKNHIIITALAIMIVIAGYLSFTNRDAKEDTDNTETANLDTDEYDEFTELDGFELVTDTTGTEEEGTVTEEEGTVTEEEGTVTEEDTTTTEEDTTLDDTNAETTGEEEETEIEATDEDADLGMEDINDEDILATAQDVTDNGELDLEEGVPGEAVLANAAIDASYFISSKIDREQRRAMSKESLRELIGSEDISDDVKQDAIADMIELIEIGEKETAAEILLEAKGFTGSVVYIVDGQVDIIVNAETLSDQQLAIVEDVIKDKTGFAVADIHITPVVVAD